MGALTIPRLTQQLDGEVFASGDDEYDPARTVFVGGIERISAEVRQCAGVAAGDR
jgi:hypothetical protein